MALTDLTSHIQTLRSFLPQSPSVEGGGRDEADRSGTDAGVGVESFMDRSLTGTWDKMSPKVGFAKTLQCVTHPEENQRGS